MWRVKFLKNLWWCVGGKMRHENVESNELARIELPPSEDHKVTLRALALRQSKEKCSAGENQTFVF